MLSRVSGDIIAETELDRLTSSGIPHKASGQDGTPADPSLRADIVTKDSEKSIGLTAYTQNGDAIRGKIGTGKDIPAWGDVSVDPRGTLIVYDQTDEYVSLSRTSMDVGQG